MRPMYFVAMVVISIVFAALRIDGYKSQAFQAFSHLWVGGLLGAYFVRREPATITAVIILSIVETICFLATHQF